MPPTNILVCLLCYVLFFIQSFIGKKQEYQRLINDEGKFTSKPGSLIRSHMMGILWLGVVPVALLDLPVWRIIAGRGLPHITWIVTYLLIFTLVIITAFKQSHIFCTKNKKVPGDLIPVSKNFLAMFIITRALFLFAYELFFRGILLFITISWLGIPAAVSLNVFLYVGVHVFNSRKEMLACIPFGLLLCFLSIRFNAVWPAMLLHTGFSLAYESNICHSYFHSPKTLSI